MRTRPRKRESGSAGATGLRTSGDMKPSLQNHPARDETGTQTEDGWKRPRDGITGVRALMIATTVP